MNFIVQVFGFKGKSPTRIAHFFDILLASILPGTVATAFFKMDIHSYRFTFTEILFMFSTVFLLPFCSLLVNRFLKTSYQTLRENVSGVLRDGIILNKYFLERSLGLIFGSVIFTSLAHRLN